MNGLSHDEIVHQTKNVRNGLSSLRDDHYNILGRIRDEYENNKNVENNENVSPTNGKRKGSFIEDRIVHVTKSLEQLEVGIEESNVLLSLSDHFSRLEADRTTLRLEMGRVQDENDWLRDELSETQSKLQEALAELEELREEKRQAQFLEELKNVEKESNVRPITPSKIPVGAWRVEEEKAINSALDSNKSSRSASPAPTRIPVFASKTSAYKKLVESKQMTRIPMSKAGQGYFKLSAPNHPKAR